MPARGGLDELPRDTNAVARLPHASFEDIADAELASDLLDVDGVAFVGEARISGDHEQRLEPRQRGDDVLDHAVGEVFLIEIAAHVLEGKDSDRRLVRKYERGIGELRNLNRRSRRCCRYGLPI